MDLALRSFNEPVRLHCLYTCYKAMIVGAANVTDSLALLRNGARSVKDGLLNGDYALWLGSGISLGRVPGLAELIYKLLKALWDKSADPTSPFRTKCEEIVAKSPGIVAGNVDPASWIEPARTTFLKSLVTKYSEIFGDEVVVNGTPLKLSKDIFDIPIIYNDSVCLPDAEHIFINGLIREGVVADIVTTNWDPLLEKAEETSRGSHSPALKVIACAEDFQSSNNGALATLLKIHGCARGCCIDFDKYYPYFIVRQLDLAFWSSHHRFNDFKTKTTSLLTGKGALFAGLSAQDFNLLESIIRANHNVLSFNPDLPRLAFAPTLGTSEKNALRAAYGDAVYTSDYQAIVSSSNIKLYGKPLFGALYLLTMFEKARTLVSRSELPINQHHIDLVDEAIAIIELKITSHYDAIPNHDERWRQLGNEVFSFLSRFLRLYRRQQIPISSAEYDSLCESSIPRLRTDDTIPSLPLPWAIVAVATCLHGQSAGLWQLSLPNDRAGMHGHLKLTLNPNDVVTLFFGEKSTALAGLEAQGFTGTGRSVIIYPYDRVNQNNPASPAATYPGTNPSLSIKEIEFRNLLESSTSITNLVDALHQELL